LREKVYFGSNSYVLPSSFLFILYFNSIFVVYCSVFFIEIGLNNFFYIVNEILEDYHNLVHEIYYHGQLRRIHSLNLMQQGIDEKLDRKVEFQMFLYIREKIEEVRKFEEIIIPVIYASSGRINCSMESLWGSTRRKY